MGHGPVALPVLVAPGAAATFALRWVSGEVYSHSVCLLPAYLSVTTHGATRRAPLAGHICGPDAAHVLVAATRLSTDPATQPCH